MLLICYCLLACHRCLCVQENLSSPAAAAPVFEQAEVHLDDQLEVLVDPPKDSLELRQMFNDNMTVPVMVIGIWLGSQLVNDAQKVADFANCSQGNAIALLRKHNGEMRRIVVR